MKGIVWVIMANNEFIKKATSLCRCFQLGLRVLH
jgi:hypothetical protein